MNPRRIFLTAPKEIAFLISMALFPATGAAREPGPTLDRECVVLIHGLGRTPQSMKRIEWNLARQGYEVINLSYPSRRSCIEELAEDYLHTAIADKISDPACKIHFVTHSLGGIILRQYLKTHPIQNPGRAVMLAPPNHGSEIADRLKNGRLGRWMLGPAGCQLVTTPGGLPNRLGAVGFDLGVVAGNRSFNPVFSRLLNGADDGKVSVESTRVDGMKDFLVVPNSHTWMPWRSGTISQVRNFLQFGHFIPDSTLLSNADPDA